MAPSATTQIPVYPLDLVLGTNSSSHSEVEVPKKLQRTQNKTSVFKLKSEQNRNRNNAFSSWTSLSWRRTAALWSFVYVMLLTVQHCQAGWQEDVEPRRIALLDPKEVLRFQGNESHPDHFKLLESDGESLLVGARNIVYNISLRDMTENVDKRMEWYSSSQSRDLCLMKGKSEDDCHNYIRVLARINDQAMLVCGTNAYNPLCRRYIIQGGSLNVEKEVAGKGMCPYDPSHNSTAVFTDGELYSGTVSDFSGLDPLIYKDPLRTEQYDLKHLNAPSFVNSIADGDYVYFFFRETAVEYMNCGKSVYSRVARVCKKDKGGNYRWASRFTSFLKSRLNCSIAGEYPFYFNEIQSTSDIVDGTYGHMSQRLIYGVFTTPGNSIQGSAVCAFRMQDVLDVFDGKFKDQTSLNSNWLPVDPADVPEPRPGQCVNDSGTLPELTLNFIKSHSLMDEAVPPFYGSPILTHTSFRHRFTKIVVDPQVRALDGKTYDMLVIGTDKGKIIRALNVEAYDSVSRVRPVVIEEIQVLKGETPITNLKIVRSSPKASPRLIVVSDDEIQSVPLHRCDTLRITSCAECVKLQDPYCAWNPATARCVPVNTIVPSDRASLVQDILTGVSDECPETHGGWTSSNDAISSTTLLVSEPVLAATCAPCVCPECPSSTSAQSTVPMTTPPQPMSTLPTPAPVPSQHSSRTLGNQVLMSDEELDIETNVIVDDRRSFAFDPDDGHSVDDNDLSPKSGPKVSASQSTAPVYTAETFIIAVVVSCFSALVLGFVGGLVFSRRCRIGDYNSGFSGLEQRNSSRLNDPSNLDPNSIPPSKMNNFIDNQPVKIANEKNANSVIDMKPIQKVKKTYV